jgi:hypothetical protein
VPDARWPQAWSDYLQLRIASDPQFLSLVPADFTLACPQYNQLNAEAQVAPIIYLIYAMALSESALVANDRFTEPGLGNDVMTGQPIVSEGLLQLSYQDGSFYGCAFDWNKDRPLAPKDLAKTIFDPNHQWDCGVRILVKQFQRVKQVFPSKSFYWSTLNPHLASYSSILATVNKAPGCL